MKRLQGPRRAPIGPPGATSATPPPAAGAEGTEPSGHFSRYDPVTVGSYQCAGSRRPDWRQEMGKGRRWKTTGGGTRLREKHQSSRMST